MVPIRVHKGSYKGSEGFVYGSYMVRIRVR